MEDRIGIEEIHKEIDLLQSCITRMAQNSFLIKGWFISLYAVVLALLPENINVVFLCIVMAVVTLLFWYLDGFFLRTEKVYRKIYDWVLEERRKNNRELLYNLNSLKHKGKIEETECVIKIMCSKTLGWFYGVPLFIVLVILFFQIMPITIICNVFGN